MLANRPAPARCLLPWGLALMSVAGLAGQTTPPAAPTPEAVAYLNAALAILEAHFLHKNQVDWASLKRDTMAQAAGARVPIDTYPAIRFALASLGDRHSYLQLTSVLTGEEAARQPRLSNPAAMPTPPRRKQSFPFLSPFSARRVPEGSLVATAARPVAQVVLPLFASDSRADLDHFATSVQMVIADLLASHPCGWLVDLRGNRGGNIWAMLAGIGPVLGEGEPGSLLDETGTSDPWFYEGGRAGLRHDPQAPDYAKVTITPVVVSGHSPVAVLIDRETGSSGEGIALAFHGRADTRFFGETTAGAATSTFPYPLSDGAVIYLVTGVMRDRDGHEYPAGVTPDEEVLSEATITTNDPVVRAASTWLVAQSTCQVAHQGRIDGGDRPDLLNR